MVVAAFFGNRYHKFASGIMDLTLACLDAVEGLVVNMAARYVGRDLRRDTPVLCTMLLQGAE